MINADLTTHNIFFKTICTIISVHETFIHNIWHDRFVFMTLLVICLYLSKMTNI